MSTQTKKLTVAAIKKAMNAAGSHWWDRDSMSFFGTVVKSPVYSGVGGDFFVTEDGRSFGWRQERNKGFTIRQYDREKNTISTFDSRVGRHSDLQEAIDLAKKLADR